MTIALEDFNSDDKKELLRDLHGFDELVNESTLMRIPSCNNEPLGSPLCVPQDPIEDLEWYPNFGDDLISLSNIDLDSGMVENEFKFLDTSEPKNFGQNLVKVLPGVKSSVKSNIPPSKQAENRGKPLSYYKSNIRNDERYNLVRPLGLEDYLTHQNVKTKKRSRKTSGRAWLKPRKGRRRCSHCQSEKTPQWREGPLGKNTLCNACGVRYKSGRLLPEYRPAASPTFDAKKHSNYHKRVLKKRGHW